MVALRPRRLARCSPSSRAQHARRCGAARGACEGMAAARRSCHPSRGVRACRGCKPKYSKFSSRPPAANDAWGAGACGCTSVANAADVWWLTRLVCMRSHLAYCADHVRAGMRFCSSLCVSCEWAGWAGRLDSVAEATVGPVINRTRVQSNMYRTASELPRRRARAYPTAPDYFIDHPNSFRRPLAYTLQLSAVECRIS